MPPTLHRWYAATSSGHTESVAFSELTSALDYPMFVVTAASPSGEPSGCLVGFATQCSIRPARYLVCLSQRNHTHGVASRASALAVHLLGRDQRHVAELFGGATGDEVDKFARCPWVWGPRGSPMLVECPHRFVGNVLERLDVGDHTAYLLEVEAAFGDGDLQLLTFQQVRDLEPGHGA